jgi:hypothetical protein
LKPIVMARWIAAIGALGVVATMIASAQGYVLTSEPAVLMQHAATGLVACLLVLFAQAWFVLFLAGTRRACDPSSEVSSVDRLELRRLALVVAAAGAVSATTTALAFVSGLLAYTRDAPPALHGGLALAAILVDTAALWNALRFVDKAEQVLRVVESGV